MSSDRLTDLAAYLAQLAREALTLELGDQEAAQRLFGEASNAWQRWFEIYLE